MKTSFDPVLAFKQAVECTENNRLSEAMDKCRRILQRLPREINTVVLYAKIAYKAKNYLVSASMFEKAIAINPSDGSNYYFAAKVLDECGQYSRAYAVLSEYFKKIIGTIKPERLIVSIIDHVFLCSVEELANYGKHIDKFGELLHRNVSNTENIVDLTRYAYSVAGNYPLSSGKSYFLLNLLGFKKEAPLQHLDAIFTNLLVPMLKRAVDENNYHLALELENRNYLVYMKKCETEKHFRYCLDQYVGAMIKAGHGAAAMYPTSENSSPTVVGYPVIGFFLLQASMLAHIEVLVAFLKGWSQMTVKPILPVVYVMCGYDQRLHESVTGCGVEIVFLEKDNSKLLENVASAFITLRTILRDRGVNAMVFVSLALHVPFAAALRLAPVQVWWAMKYHSMDIPEIEGYFTNGSFEKKRIIDGRQWQVVHSALDRLYDPSQSVEAKKIREHIGLNYTVLGTMGREEKIENKDFLLAITSILRARPNTYFLWTGRVKSEVVQNYFEQAGLTNRCLYIGWINTRLYAQVLDIYLDSFPFGGGHTIFQSWAATKPVVMMRTRETEETGVPMHILPVLNNRVDDQELTMKVKGLFTSSTGGDISMIARSMDEYFDMAVRLIDDVDYRGEVASAGKEFVEKYMCNHRVSAESFCSQIDGLFSAMNKKE